MRKICDLDVRIYRCVSPDLRTSEVILTEERMDHIMRHHPGDYERFSAYLSRALLEPDYILQDIRPHTAMVLKELEEAGEYFRLALRLATPADNPAYKNSVLTFMKIREKEWNRLIRNKVVLYKGG